MRLDISTQSFRDAKNHIYGLAHNVCINGNEQRELLAHMLDIELKLMKDNSDGKEIILNLLGLVIDAVHGKYKE